MSRNHPHHIAAAALLVLLLGAVTLADAARAGSAPPSHDPYLASLAFARCMRAHGVPHPDPDRRGNFRLTPTDERRMRSVARSKRQAAEKTCFHYLSGLNNSPLSSKAKARAIKVLQELRRCVAKHGYKLGKPVVTNMSRGRAFFGFRSAGPGGPSKHRAQVEHLCEKQVDLDGRIDKIIADDRRIHNPGGL
jgi:hypothetical protein